MGLDGVGWGEVGRGWGRMGWGGEDFMCRRVCCVCVLARVRMFVYISRCV